MKLVVKFGAPLFAFVILFLSVSSVNALVCPSGLIEQCSAPVLSTKTNSCFTPTLCDAGGVYVSHVTDQTAGICTVDCQYKDDGTCVQGSQFNVYNVKTSCSTTTCTCVSQPPTSCTTDKVPFANKKLEVRESTATMGSELYTYSMDTLAYGNVDIRTGASESYDIYKSDIDGNPLSGGEYLTIYEKRDYIGDDQGNNIDSAVLIDNVTGVRYPAVKIVSSMKGSSQGGDGMPYNALGEPDGKYTYMGDKNSRITLGFSSDCLASPSPSPIAATGQCTNTKVYTNGWVELTPTAFKGLSAGIQVYFCVNGVTNSSVFDAGRFTINGTMRPQTTLKRPNTNDFCELYTIPANTYNFKVQGELHHAKLGWL